ncbi:MAG: TIGR03960 family B12-binding radical SAM protein [Clostridiales bacterium]|jgi:radical SAM family uncharacterized protein|nr:TIGR03960 family B12-binding radical SAM protein [Clostridiales bacterium]
MTLTDEILKRVEKPARYTGGEINMVRKELNAGIFRFGFCFPDVYEVGMSHLGMQILYFFLNNRPDVYCERFFAPWTDMERIMREENFALFSVETASAAADFDILGFTLQYEMSFTNIVNMLNLAGIPILSKDRGENFPLICAGGPCALNPEPLAEIFDFFYLGEGEVQLGGVIDTLKQYRAEKKSKAEVLFELAKKPGIYVPVFYDVSYNENGSIKSFAPNTPEVPEIIRRVVVEDLDSSFFPEVQLVALIETVHERVTLEVFRGCIRGCRFCHAGFIYRPVRERMPETLLKQAKKLISNTGHDEISLVSLSTSDYTCFKELSLALVENFTKDKVNLSLPSLRVDAFTLELMERVQSVRKSSLTFAPEAGSQRLRNVINKGITEDDILSGALMAFNSGISRLKMYFMVGLPTETGEDLQGIAELAEKIVSQFYTLPKEKRGAGLTISISSACFVPKAHTPFQWERQNSFEEFAEKQKSVKNMITRKQIKYSYHDAYTAVIEGVLARGDRRAAKVIIKAWELGARFDAWGEYFSRKTWERAFEETGINPDVYTREKKPDEILPWDHIDIGVTREFLLREREKAYKEELTPNCREACANCGINCR